jgi:heme/copper-type cytochrome/quinol oxidase subunit 2
LLRATGTFVLPTHNTIRLLATAEDVTHSWAVPGLGLKLDCVPGRLFVSFLCINREGVYYGQCSELCGWNHYNMPIVLYALAYEHFLVWWELELHVNFTHSAVEGLGTYSLLNLKYK